MSDLEQRLRRLEDRFEIEELCVQYFLASDSDDYEAIAHSFADKSTFSAGGFPAGEGGQGVADMIRGARQAFGNSIHTPNYVVINFIDDDNATGLVGAHLEIATGGTTVYAAVRYEDELTRESGRWVFRSRNMKSIFVTPWADVDSSLTAEATVRWPGADATSSDYPRAQQV